MAGGHALISIHRIVGLGDSVSPWISHWFLFGGLVGVLCDTSAVYLSL